MARRHAEPEALPDSLSSHKKQKHAHETSQSPLLAYHYVITAIIPLLSDGDVLTRLLVTGRAFKPALLNYQLKQTLHVNSLDLVEQLAEESRYLPVYAVKLRGLRQPLDNDDIPAFVTSISVCDNFNQPLTRDSLPLGLKSLKLGHWFNRSIDCSMLPSSLTELELGCGFSMPLTLPTSITKLTLARSLARINVIGSLSSLTELVLGVDDQPLQAGVLPLGLTKLSLRQPITLGSIPESVTYLSYDYWSSIPVGAIPSSVKRLTLSHCDHPLLSGVIPDSVTDLQLDHMKCAIITRSLPSSVRELTLGKYFVQKLTPDLLPDNLVKCTYHDVDPLPAKKRENY